LGERKIEGKKLVFVLFCFAAAFVFLFFEVTLRRRPFRLQRAKSLNSFFFHSKAEFKKHSRKKAATNFLAVIIIGDFFEITVKIKK